jgi:hypothetical protein
VSPNLRDIADRMNVEQRMGDCFVCAGLIHCAHPELCYGEQDNGTAE